MKLKALLSVVTIALVWAPAKTSAAILATNLIAVTDPASLGVITVLSNVHDNYLGDFTKMRWEYIVTNLSFDPLPGVSNGLAGFQLVFPQAVPGAGAMQAAPGAGWAFNAFSGIAPPWGVEYDITAIVGLGIMPPPPVIGVGTFDYSTPLV